MWSNGPMPEASSTAPEFDPLVVEQATPGDVAARLRRPWRGRVVGAGLAVVAAAVIVIVAVGDDNRSADVAEDEPAAETTVEPGPPATLAPVTARYPIGWSVVDVRDEAPQILPAAIADDWTEWSIPAPAPLDAMTLPTEVVAVTDAGVLHRIEFPSGQVSSRSLPELGPSGQIAVADGSVAIPTGNDVVLAGDDGSLVVWNVPSDRPPRVTTLGSRFLVGAAGEAGGPDRQWLLDVDGTVTDIPDGPFARFPAWEPFGLPSGELLADDGGDIVVVGLDGRVRPIDEGRLLAAGPNHYVVQTCYRRSCDYELVDLETAQRTPAALVALDAYRFFDTSIRVSPDGRFVRYADWRRDRPLIRIVEVTGGATIDVGELGDIRTPGSWASDSSGVFVIGDDGIVFRSVDGRTAAVIDGLGSVRSVATRVSGEG